MSALYPTVGTPYARAGWATCGELGTVDLPTGMLPRGGADPGLTVRPADPSRTDVAGELADTAALYASIARHATEC